MSGYCASYGHPTGCRRLAAPALSLLASLTACTDMPGTVPSDQVYIGLVRVQTPRTEGDLTAYKIQALGAGIGDGAIVGWQSKEVVSAAPDKCQLVIIIRSDVTAANARDVLSRIGDRKPCVADFSSK